jgi:ketosteroid isomerase-like protein
VVREEVHDAHAHIGIIHASSTAETDIGPYANEYALILKFTEDGKKVTNFDEFVDSAYTNEFWAALLNEDSEG